ncbi:MAG: hypothetical protein CMK00_00340 [Planctomycetes bacterium]|jgi:hypothetical protein|nr:hypothetical protein [Planctomycetota bacterium]HJO26271.1 hypothetical protein [Planctomycetota bacterium]
MKNLLLGLALAGLTFACNSDQTAQMSDASEVLPACATGPDCDKADMAGCEMMGKSKVGGGCEMIVKDGGCPMEGAPKDGVAAKKAGGGCCESKKAEAEKVCPMTGKVIE